MSSASTLLLKASLLSGRLFEMCLHPSAFKAVQDLRHYITPDNYTLRPFDETRSIFIHIPKCAGISINNSLYGNLAGGHRTLDEYVHIFEPNNIINYFKFSFVRNPWDRVVSAYHYLKDGGLGEKDKNIFRNELSEFKNFDDFVMNWLNERNIWKSFHFMPQYYFIIATKLKIKLDFIGYFENLESDFNYVKNKLAINSNLLKQNKSNRRNYRVYYNKKSIEKVANVYSRDIELLGYTFDNSNLKNLLTARNNAFQINKSIN